MIAEFDRRRKVVVDGLEQAAGRVLRDAEGRVLCVPQHQAHRLEGEGARQSRCSMTTGVAIIGGPDFGILGEGYVRLSYANSTENILKALDRMGDFLASRKAA